MTAKTGMDPDPTKLNHYMRYPICGGCYNAWDTIYVRQRHGVNPVWWVENCRVGGCDPDVWDYLDTTTGWPKGWQVDAQGRPNWEQVLGLKLPKHDNRVFHRRGPGGEAPNAPWRQVSKRLLAQASERAAIAKKGIPDDQIIWDDPEEAQSDPVEVPTSAPDVAETDDDLEW